MFSHPGILDEIKKVTDHPFLSCRLSPVSGNWAQSTFQFRRIPGPFLLATGNPHLPHISTYRQPLRGHFPSMDLQFCKARRTHHGPNTKELGYTWIWFKTEGLLSSASAAQLLHTDNIRQIKSLRRFWVLLVTAVLKVTFILEKATELIHNSQVIPTVNNSPSISHTIQCNWWSFQDRKQNIFFFLFLLKKSARLLF